MIFIAIKHAFKIYQCFSSSSTARRAGKCVAAIGKNYNAPARPTPLSLAITFDF